MGEEGLATNLDRRTRATGPATSADDDLLIHREIGRLANASPDAIALTFEGQHLSYSALDRLSDRHARYLLDCGVGVEEVVAISAERSIEVIVGILAVLKAGAAYLPLDPAYPRDRLDFMLRDSGARLVLVGDEQSGMFRGLDVQEAPLRLDDPPTATTTATVTAPATARTTATLSARAVRPLPRRAAPDSLAYVMYTSGSTGRPKGIMVPHRAVINHVRWRSDRFGLGPQDRTLQRTPISFDISVWEITGALLTGGMLVLPRPGAQKQSACLVDAIVEHEVTTFQIVPSMLKLMLREPKIGQCHSLRRVFSGGEVLSPDLAETCQATIDATLVNVYGPTETTIDTTFWVCDSRAGTRTIPIGHPVAHTRALVLDGMGRPLPAGEEGTLFIGGAGLARGYWRRPDRTAEAFVPSPAPVSNAPGERLYNTGDMALATSGGAIEFAGRRDGQVKIRGVRIELQEIEHALKTCPLVEDGVAMIRTREGGARGDQNGDPQGDQKIVCYYVLKTREINVAATALRYTRYHEIRDFLASRLPDFMVPHHLVNVDTLPLLPNGKINTRALPEPAYYTPGGGEGAAPKDEKERLLAEVWCSVLGVPAVSCEDQFVYYGGDSLHMVEVRLAAQKRGLLVDLSVRHQNATIRSLASNSVWTSDRRASWPARVREFQRFAWLATRAQVLETVDRFRQRRTLALERPDRERFRAFYDALPNKQSIYYLFFRRGLLHWVAKQLEFVPKDVNLVLIGSALTEDERDWLRRHTQRPFFHINLRVDADAAWEFLFETNQHSFGWIDIGCFVNNSALFRELAQIDDDVAFNCVFTHTERHRRTFIEYLLFVNIRAIRALAAAKVKVYPSRYGSAGGRRHFHANAYVRVPGMRDRALVRRMLLEEKKAGTPGLVDVVVGQKVFEIGLFIGHMFLLHVQQLGFRIHRVRHLTAATHLNYSNFFSDEVIMAPHVLSYEDIYPGEGPGFEGDLSRTRQADYLLLRSMIDELPVAYASKLADLQGKILDNGVNLEDAPGNVSGHLVYYGVSPQVLDRPQWRFLRAATPHQWAGTPATTSR